jgi:hypothetical protein
MCPRIDLDDILVLWLSHPPEQESVDSGVRVDGESVDRHGAPSWRLSVRD